MDGRGQIRIYWIAYERAPIASAARRHSDLSSALSRQPHRGDAAAALKHDRTEGRSLGERGFAEILAMRLVVMGGQRDRSGTVLAKFGEARFARGRGPTAPLPTLRKSRS